MGVKIKVFQKKNYSFIPHIKNQNIKTALIRQAQMMVLMTKAKGISK